MPTGSRIRVADPVLTTVAIGYHNAEYVGHELFPEVPVTARAGKIIEFDKREFKLYRTKRAPGSNIKRIEVGYDGKPYAMTQDALEGLVPIEDDEEAKAVPGIDLGMEAVEGVMETIALGKEYEAASIARNPANYDADHKIDLAAAKWSDDANDPIKDLKAGKEAIRASIGVDPNRVVFSPKAWSALTENAKVKDRYKHTTSQTITTDMIAAAIEVEKVVVGKAVFIEEGAADDTLGDVWGRDVVMAYVGASKSDKGKAKGRSKRRPSFGYTYCLKNHPLVEKPYYENNCRSWIYQVINENTPVLTGVTAGYLFQNVA